MNAIKQYYNRLTLVAFFAFALLIATRCTTSTETGKPVIVCTTGMIGDAVTAFVGDDAEVVTLMGPGIDPHLYKPTQGDLKKLRQAKIIVYNGLFLEGKMQEILERLDGKVVIAVSDFIPENRILQDPENGNAPDPHIWFDLTVWHIALSGTAERIQQVFSETPAITERARTYLKALATLHSEVRQQLQQIPEQQRILITAHDAFQYFGKAYQLEVESLQGISTASEYGLQDITNLVNRIVNDQIPAIFLESSIAPRSLEAVVEGCKKKGHNVRIGGELYSDALGPKGSPAESFFGTVQHNVTTLVAGLAPQQP